MLGVTAVNVGVCLLGLEHALGSQLLCLCLPRLPIFVLLGHVLAVLFKEGLALYPVDHRLTQVVVADNSVDILGWIRGFAVSLELAGLCHRVVGVAPINIGEASLFVNATEGDLYMVL
jgi:hypothetical protein